MIFHPFSALFFFLRVGERVKWGRRGRGKVSEVLIMSFQTLQIHDLFCIPRNILLHTTNRVTQIAYLGSRTTETDRTDRTDRNR